MAVRADAAGDDVRRATNPTGDHTVLFWCYPTTVAAGTFRALYWAGTDVDGTASEGIYMDGDDLQWWAGSDAAARISQANVMLANTWQFVAAVGRGATGSACELFRGTLTAAATSSGTGTRAAGSALSGNRLIFGNDIFTTFGNARIFNPIIYDRVLTLAEIRQQQFSRLPIIQRPWGWWDVIADDAGGIADRSGNSRGLTETGTVTVEASAPIDAGDMPFGWNATAAAGGAFSMTMDVGSYAVTGVAVGLRAGRRMAIATGSYVITGSSAAADYVMAIGTGAYSVAGQDVTLTYSASAASMVMDTGVYTITGQNVGMLVARRMQLTSGVYAISGQDVRLAAARRMAIATGSYAHTGVAVGLASQRRMAIGTGDYQITGQDVAFSVTGDKAMVMDAGSYALQGFDVGLLYTPTPPPQADSLGGSRWADMIDDVPLDTVIDVEPMYARWNVHVGTARVTGTAAPAPVIEAPSTADAQQPAVREPAAPPVARMIRADVPPPTTDEIMDLLARVALGEQLRAPERSRLAVFLRRRNEMKRTA